MLMLVLLDVGYSSFKLATTRCSVELLVAVDRAGFGTQSELGYFIIMVSTTDNTTIPFSQITIDFSESLFCISFCVD